MPKAKTGQRTPKSLCPTGGAPNPFLSLAQLAYAYPRSDGILDALKGVLHTSDSFSNKLANAQV